MAKTTPLNTANPAGSTDRKEGDDYIREISAALKELIGVDHNTGTDTSQATAAGAKSHGLTDDAAGEHAKVTLRELAVTPTGVAAKGFIYTKDVGSGVIELFYVDESDNEKQITNAGSLNISATEAMLLTGAQTATGVKTFSSGIACGSKAVTAVLDPISAQEAATKNYVDTVIQSPVQETLSSSFTGTSGFQTFITADITLSKVASVLVLFTGSFGRRADTAAGQVQIRVDGSVKNLQTIYSINYGYGPADCSLHWLEVDLSAAAHTIDVQVKGASFKSFSGNNHFRVLTLIPQL